LRWPITRREDIIGEHLHRMTECLRNPVDDVEWEDELEGDLISVYFLAFEWNYCAISMKAIEEVRALRLPPDFDDWRTAFESDLELLRDGRRLFFRVYFND